MGIFDNESEDQHETDPLLKEPLSLELAKSLLTSAMSENDKLRRINRKLQSSVLRLRDKVALAIYAKHIEMVSAQLAAEDAYKLADIFLRVREGNRDQQESIINQFLYLARQYPNDQSFGAAMRETLNKLKAKADEN